MKRPFSSVLALILASLAISGCNQSGNYRTGRSDAGINESTTGAIDQKTGDIIKQVEDEDGNLIDCTTGKSSWRRGLPSCNEIVAIRKKEENKRQAQMKEEAALEAAADKQRSDLLFYNKLSGEKLFTLPNGGKIKVATRVRYNDESGNALIINAIVSRKNATQTVFENLFIIYS